MVKFRFEKLEVWQHAIDFANDVYEVTRRFPDDERFGLTSQLRRASISVSSNIAEGSSRSSDRDFSRDVETAYGSLMEIVSQLRLAKNQHFLAEGGEPELRHKAEQLARMLSGLRSHLQAKHKNRKRRRRK